MKIVVLFLVTYDRFHQHMCVHYLQLIFEEMWIENVAYKANYLLLLFPT